MAQLNTAFNRSVNALFNNSLFSAAKNGAMHKTAERLYLAAAELKRIKGQSKVARVLNESPQTIKNWESRGVSRPGAIKAQAAIGVSANWLLSGDGAMAHAPGTVGTPGPTAFYDVPSPEDQALLENWSILPDADKARYFNEIAERAEQMRQYLSKHMQKAGLPAPKSAAERARSKLSARTSATPASDNARQRSLLEEPGKK